jgi:voltage-gated potassium channel
MRKGNPVIGFLVRHRSELLLCLLIADIIASPAADYHPLAGAGLALVIVVGLLAASSYMARERTVRMVAWPIVGVWFVARALEAFGDAGRWYTHLAPIAGLALSVSILWAIFERFNSVPRIPTNAIAEAFISYLIIAIAFSQLYWILSRFVANPFNQIIPENHSGTLLYFSMITLSSVGYGGIIPINPYVRLIAALESMIGIFYIAVVVARLVSAYRPIPVSADHDSKSLPSIEN